MSELVEAVRELRTLTGCGLKVALEHVRAGWSVGDPVSVDLIRERDEKQAAKYRLERAAPDLLEALQLTRMSRGWQYMSDEAKSVIDAALTKALVQTSGVET